MACMYGRLNPGLVEACGIGHTGVCKGGAAVMWRGHEVSGVASYQSSFHYGGPATGAC